MKMQPSAWLILVLLLQACSAEEYQFKTVKGADLGKPGIELIVPPYSSYSFKKSRQGDFSIAKHSRYQFVLITGLNSLDYYKSLEAISQAEYLTHRVPFESIQTRSKIQKLNLSSSSFINADQDYIRVAYNPSRTNVLIELDFDKVLKNDPQVVFRQMGVTLLQELSVNESSNRWQNTLSQHIVEKVFELVPSPAEVSLSRYGLQYSQENQDEALVLLGPKICIKVDNAVKLGGGGDKWEYSFISESYLHFNWEPVGSQVLLKYSPIVKRNLTKYPTNSTVSNINISLVHLASTMDFQSSSALNSKRYVAFYQAGFKRNSSLSGAPNEDDRKKANSYLLFADSLNQFYDYANWNEQPLKGVLPATYGERVQLIPMISISLNGELLRVPLGTRLAYLWNSATVPQSAKAYRMYADHLVRLKSPSRNLLLLTGDKFVF